MFSQRFPKFVTLLHMQIRLQIRVPTKTEGKEASGRALVKKNEMKTTTTTTMREQKEKENQSA